MLWLGSPAAASPPPAQTKCRARATHASQGRLTPSSHCPAGPRAAPLPVPLLSGAHPLPARTPQRCTWAGRHGERKLWGVPSAWVVFGGVTSPSASPTIWMASASSVILQCCLQGQQNASFSRGQLCTLSSQTQAVHTGDMDGFIRGDPHLHSHPWVPGSLQSSLRWRAGLTAGDVRHRDECHAWQHANQSSAFSGAVWCYQLHVSLEWKETWIF